MTSQIVQKLSDFPGLYELIQSGESIGPITRQSAMRLSAVYACVNAIACDLAGLPVHVCRKVNGNVERVSDHPVSELIKLNPNPEMRAFDWHRVRRYHTLLSGNSAVVIERSKTNPVKYLWPVDPDELDVERVDSASGRGRIRFRVSDGIGRPKYYNPQDILHLKGYTWDGVDGCSVITYYASQQIGIGLELDQFEKSFLAKGMHPGGLFEHPGVMKEPNKTSFLDAIKKRFGGSKNAGAPMVLESGMKYHPYEVKMVDQQFMDLLKLNKSDICGIFGVPQSRIGISDSNTNYNNTEQEKRRYYESGLLPWAIPDEQELTFKLLTQKERMSGFYIKYNFDGFLRGDSKTRAEVSRIWHQMGVPVNDLLSIDDRNPVDGGDTGMVNGNMIPIGAVKDVVVSQRSVLLPVLSDAIDQIVNRENIALSKTLKKNDGFEHFYRDFNDFIVKKMSPFAESYGILTGKTFNIKAFSDGYIARSKMALSNNFNQETLDFWRLSRSKHEANSIMEGFDEK